MANRGFDPEKFIVSDVDIKTTNNGKFYFQFILLHGRKVQIIGKAAEDQVDFIEFKSYRPRNVSAKSISFVNTISQTEYFEDLLNFFYILAQLEPEISSLPLSLLKVCESHVKRANRLIDTDLYTYCDEAVIVSEIVLNSSDPNFIMPESDKIEMWHEYEKIVFEHFKDFIYLTKYKRENPFDIQVKSYLEKLT